MEQMRRYLDVDLDAGMVSTENLKRIRKRILKDYSVDLEMVAKDKVQYMELERKIMHECQLNEECNDIRKLLFLQDDLEVMGESLYRLQRNQGSIIRASESVMKDEKVEDRKLTDEQILKMYDEIVREEEIESLEEGISFEDCVKLIEYIVSKSIIFDIDYMLQFFLRHNYTKVATKKYNYFENRKDEKIDIRSRLKDEEFFPMIDWDLLPVFTKDLQSILFTQRYLRLFEFSTFGIKSLENDEGKKSSSSADITRYSYKYIEEIYAKVKESSFENIYYLNDMLGITLTNTIFNCIYSNVKKRDDEKDAKIHYEIINVELFKAATLLGKLKCIYSRDILAKIVFRFLFPLRGEKEPAGAEVEEIYQNRREACDQICSYLETNIDKINHYYNDLCDVNTWLWEEKSKTELEFDKVIRPEFEKNYKVWMKCRINNREVDERLGNDAMKYDKNYRIRKMKMIKEPDNLYAQIHMAVMKGIWE